METHVRSPVDIDSSARSLVIQLASHCHALECHDLQNRAAMVDGLPSRRTLFEPSWKLSTLLANGFPADTLRGSGLDAILEFMLKILRDQSEKAGSAEFTAVSFLTLSLGERQFQVQNLNTSSISARELRMKPKEFMASITGTSCLLATLLNMPDISEHGEKIEKMVKLLVDAFDGGSLLEDGNLSPNHNGMLLVGVLVAFIYRWDHGAIDGLDNETTRDKVPHFLFQALKYICSKQEEDGSWESSSTEPTAYAVITLAHLIRLPWHPSVMPLAETTLEKGRQYLEQDSDTWNDPSFFRAEKVTFSSAIL